MAMRARSQTLVAAACLAAQGCSGTDGPGSAALSPPVAPVTAQAPAASYQLSAEEQALDCKKLTGRMQVRILQIRDHGTRPTTSETSQVLQSTVSSVIGVTQKPVDPGSRYAQDRAQLVAYNQQLAAKGCKTFNLDEELQPKPVSATPTPKAADTKKTP